MNLRAIGISHHTAAVDVRERMWFAAEEARQAVARLHEQFFSECMLISTCNRTELYGVVRNPQVEDAALKSALISLKGVATDVLPEHLTSALDGDAVQHLFEVAAGIDSMIIGDIQILNQVKEAFNLSREVNALGPVTNRLMQSTLHVGKRVRTETTICEGAVSVSYAAVELASKIFADLSKKAALLIGAGETGELTMKHLVGKGIGKVYVANRTRARADALVAQLGGVAVDYQNMPEALRQVDIVITSVSSPTYIVGPDDVLRVMKQRGNNPLFLIDIGVPRNIDPICRRIENVFLYDMDSLHAIVDRNLENRRAEIPRVHAIVEEELVSFFRWHNSLQVGPTIHDFRESLEAIRQQEVEKNINRFRPEDRELVELLTKRIVNKILHQPTTMLKGAAEDGHDTIIRMAILRELFGIANNGQDHGDE